MMPIEPAMQDRIVAALKTVFDPELPINVYDLGLIYGLSMQEGGTVKVSMSLTAPNCPMADVIVARVKEAVAKVEGVSGAEVELVWEPAWSPEIMSESARMELELTGWVPGGSGGTTGLTIGRKPGRKPSANRR